MLHPMARMLRQAALLIAAAFILVAPGLAARTDIPVAGRQLSLGVRLTDPPHRRAAVVLHDAAIAPPFADPSTGATLRIASGAAAGQCNVEIALDPAKWSAIGGNGERFGYLYRDAAPGTEGVRRAVIRPGQIAFSARGAAWPCDLAASTQRAPVTVELYVAQRRYCGSFAALARNRPGRVLGLPAVAPEACTDSDLTAANLNVLHGVLCPRASRQCRLTDRIPLLFQWIVASGCPDVVTLQEVSTQVAALVREQAASACPFPYTIVHQRSLLGIDDEMILTRYPAAAYEVVPLYRDFRHLLHARLDHPMGAIDVFTTHLASSSDQAEDPCGEDCPADCFAAGAATVRDCQAVQVADLVRRLHDVTTPALVTGDFNDSPGSFVYTHLVSQGWTDAYLAAGNPECDAATGVGCTSGREDEALDGLESPESNQVERIDYIFLVPPAPGSVCAASVDTPDDADGDGTPTRIFADDPNPFAPRCGPAPDPICWPSDHEGVVADVNCNGAGPAMQLQPTE
jgi:endonuclease/exonuclease/phosphatase family metal-dependent hydrolase